MSPARVLVPLGVAFLIPCCSGQASPQPCSDAFAFLSVSSDCTAPWNLGKEGVTTACASAAEDTDPCVTCAKASCCAEAVTCSSSSACMCLVSHRIINGVTASAAAITCAASPDASGTLTACLSAHCAAECPGVSP